MSAPDQTRKQRREQARAARRAAEQAAVRREQRNRRLRLLSIISAAAVAAVLVIALIATGSGSDGKPDQDAKQASASYTGIPQAANALGDPGAPVTLVEFADLQCPYCAQFARDALPELVRDYVRTGKLRIEFQPIAILGADSDTAARAVHAAAQQNLMFQYTAALFAQQGRENSGYVTQQFLADAGRQVPGLDTDRVLADLYSRPVDESMKAAVDLAARHQINSTPSFLIGRTGKQLHALPVSSLTAQPFRQAIDDLLGDSETSR